MENIPIRHLNTSQKSLELAESFSIRDLHELLEGKDLIQDLHRHDFYFIMAIEMGEGAHEIDFKSYKVCDHCIFFMRPGQVHKVDIKAGGRGFLMQFKTDLYHPQDTATFELLRTVSQKTFCQLSDDVFAKLKTALNTIHLEFNNKQEQYGEVIKANLQLFFIELLRFKRHSSNPGTQSNHYQQERLEEFLIMLETHIAKRKEVSFFTEKLNLSAFQLNAITKKLLGKTCSEVIDDYVILEGKRYLLATSSQINQIAYHLGFEDPSYFVRFFKKHTGHSPEAFRQNFK